MSAELEDKMRALVINAHAHQPYAVHVLSVGDIVKEMLEIGDECGDAELRRDIYLAAVGHDLYEDTSVTPEQIRTQFGARVDALIEGMTNRQGDHDRVAYEANMRSAREEVRLIKLADLVDNVLSCAYGIHDLGRQWIVGTFLPIAEGMTRTVKNATYERYPRTSQIALAKLDFALARLRSNLAIDSTVAAASGIDERARAAAVRKAWDGTIKVDPDAERKDEERARREGWLVKGMRAFKPE